MFTRNKVIPLLLLFFLFIGLTCFIYTFLPVIEHWHDIFRPAALNLLKLENPFNVEKFFNPPWALAFILPFALLPERLGNALYAATSLFGFGYAAYRFGAKPVAIIAFLTLPFTLYNAVQVNVDWLVVIGATLPPQIGLFLVLLKPQLGIFIAFYWFVQIWREEGWKSVLKVFSPVLLAFILSFVIFGNYFTKAGFLFLAKNKNFWPYSLPIGLVFLIFSLLKKKPGLSLSSSPFLAPYIQSYSWPIGLIGLFPNQYAFYLATIGLWVIFSVKFQWMWDLFSSFFNYPGFSK